MARSQIFQDWLDSLDGNSGQTPEYSNESALANALAKQGLTALPGAGAGSELAYAEITSNVVVTSTVGSGDLVVAAPAVVFSGAQRVRIEFYSANVQVGAGGVACYLLICDAGVPFGYFGYVEGSGVASTVQAVRFITPTAGSHTYSVRAYRGATGGTVAVFAGAGTGNSTASPAYIRVTAA
jgi:hypothetical protein